MTRREALPAGHVQKPWGVETPEMRELSKLYETINEKLLAAIQERPDDLAIRALAESVRALADALLTVRAEPRG